MSNLKGIQTSLGIYHLDQEEVTIPTEWEFIPGNMHNAENWTNFAGLLVSAGLVEGVGSSPTVISETRTPLRCPSDLPIRHERMGRMEEFNSWPDVRAGKVYRNEEVRRYVQSFRVPNPEFAGQRAETSYGLNGANKESNIFTRSTLGGTRPDGRSLRDHPYSRYGAESGQRLTGNGRINALTVVRESSFETAPSSLISAFDGQRYHYSSFDAYSIRHNNRINVSFFDGHVESLDNDQLPSMMYSDFERDASRRPTSWYLQ